MPSDTQSNINVSHFDKLIARLEEAFHYYQDERGVEEFRAYLIPVLKDAKNPESFGPVYERDQKDQWKVRESVRLKGEEAHNRILKGHGNVGLIGFKDVYCKNPMKPDYWSFVIFDFDIAKGKGTTVFPKDKLLAWFNEKRVFATRTRSGGYQVIGVNDGRYDNALIYYDGIKAGEIRAWKEYALIAGSYVPVTEEDRAAGNVAPDATGRYEVINDVPVRVIEHRDLPDGFEIRADDARVKHALETLKVDISVNPNIKREWKSELNELTVDDLREEDERFNELMEGPFDEDRSGGDFYVVRQLWRHRFTPQQISEILRYYRYYEKTEREDYVTHTIAKVLGTPQIRTKGERQKDPIKILENVESYKANEFPPTLPRDKYVIHMRGLPRVGKSRHGLIYITQRGGGTYVTINHSIIEQQFNSMINLAPDLTSVWLVGKHHACRWTNPDGRKGDCEHCAYKPTSIYQHENDYRTLTTRNYEDIALKAIARFKHLRWELIRENIIEVCPYYLLHYAEKHVKVCFTVPQFTTSEESLTRVSEREFMVIDEDPSFNYYEPQSIELLEFAVYGVNISTTSHLTRILESLESLIEEIKRKERKPWWDKTILDMIQRYEMMEEMFEEFNQNPTAPVMAGGNRTTVSQAREALRARLLNLDYKFYHMDTREDREIVMKKLDEYERDLGVSTDDGLTKIFEPFIYPFKNNRFVWVGDILYMIGDKEQIIRMPARADQYLLIGFTEAELFAQYLLRTKRTARDIKENIGQTSIEHDFDRNALRVELTHFPYGENFNAILFGGSSPKQKRLFRRLLKWIDQENVESEETKTPYLVLTASKSDQEHLWSTLNSGEVHMSRKESIFRTKLFWRIGLGVIFYQNSTISRGIDVPWFDAIFVHSVKFAQPYWKAAHDYGERWYAQSTQNLNSIKSACLPDDKSNFAVVLAEEDQANAKKYLDRVENIENSKLSDETTNAVLRLSPIPGVEDKHQKFIIIKENDFDLINSNATKNMNIYHFYEGMDLTLLGVEIQKGVKQPNPTAIFAMDDIVEMKKNPEVPQVQIDEKLKLIPMSIGALLGEKLVGLETLISTLPDSVSANFEIEEVCDFIIRNVFVPIGEKRRSEESLMKMAFRMLRSDRKDLKKKVRAADIRAAIRHLIDTKRLIIESERKDNKLVEYYRLGEVKKKHEPTTKKRPLAPTHGQETDW